MLVVETPDCDTPPGVVGAAVPLPNEGDNSGSWSAITYGMRRNHNVNMWKTKDEVGLQPKLLRSGRRVRFL